MSGIGKASFTETALVENIRALVDAVVKAKPQGSKGQYVKKVSLSSTMGPGLKLDASDHHQLVRSSKFYVFGATRKGMRRSACSIQTCP